MNKKEPTLLKRAVIKEELVAITGDFISALILNQFLYWTERMKNVDAFLEEESNRNKEGEGQDILPTKGFFYKSADELNNELMLGLSGPSMRSYIRKIVRMGYVYERRNPYHKWDKTLQYRVNIIKLQNDLELKGYSLNKYPLSKNLVSISKNLASISENLVSNQNNLAAIPEINNTENINNNNKKIYKKVLGSDENTNSSKKENIESFQKTKQLAADKKTNIDNSRYLPIAEQLAAVLKEKQNITTPPSHIPKWAKDIRLLCEERNINPGRLQRELKIYAANFGNTYRPIIECGASLRKKITSFWNFLERCQNPTETKKQSKQNNDSILYIDKTSPDRYAGVKTGRVSNE